MSRPGRSLLSVRAWPLRLRVAAAFGLAAAVALGALAAFVHVRVSTTLMHQAEVTLASRADALAQVPAAERGAATGRLTGESFGQVLAPDGTVLGHSPGLESALVALPADGGFREVRVRLPIDDERERALLLVRRDAGQVLVVGTSLESVEEAKDSVLTALLVGGPLALLLACGLGYVVAGVALRPVERMRRRAESITAATSGERLPVPTADDEIRRLGITLNEMLDRMDAGLARERRFVAEASHELRTPLTLLKAELELALARPRDPEELRATIRSADEEVDRLAALTEDLLLLAGPGAPARDTEPLVVLPLLEEVADRFRAALSAQGRTIEVAGDAHATATGDRHRLGRAVANLVDNAVRHGAGRIGVGVVVHAGRVRVTVSDEGVGPPEEVAGREVDPFSRGGSARTRPGHGLGLAIVRTLAEEYDGTLHLDTLDGRFEATLDLPAAPPVPGVTGEPPPDRRSPVAPPTA